MGMKDEILPPSGAPLSTPSERVWSRFLAFLDELPATTRAVFLLHEVFGFGHADIAFVLGIAQDECRDQFERAQARARACRIDDTGRLP